MKKLAIVIFILLSNLSLLFAQRSPLPPLELIDLPTAGTLARGSYVSSLRLYPNGGVLAELNIGFSNRFYLGISFGGENIIGEGKVNWNPEPGFSAAYRIIDENLVLPAIKIGFNSQGYGPYLKSENRYTIKSRGFYAVASKNYVFLGDLSFHGGLNYSRENDDGDKDINLFAGIMKSVNTDLDLLLDYDFAINDNSTNSLGSGKGYLNIGVRWLFAKRLSLQFQFKNILKNKENIPHSNREIKIAYIEYF